MKTEQNQAAGAEAQEHGLDQKPAMMRELLAVLRLLHAECMDGKPSLLTMEFAAKAIGKATP